MSKGREPLEVSGIFGSFTLLRRYYHHAGKRTGHHPADAALGLEVAHTPALARLLCLEGADETCFEKASSHLREAIRRGLMEAPQTVLLVDGASGLEKLGRDYFADAVQIVDFFHAMEHLKSLIEALLGTADKKATDRRLRCWKQLLEGNGVESIIKRARKEAFRIGRVEDVEKELHYFLNNVERMQYGTFRDKHFFIGSGVVEAGCKSVIGQRCKQSGMRWSVKGAENVLVFRCIQASRRLDDFWKYRRNSLAI